VSIKAPNNVEIVQTVRPCRATLPKNWKFLPFRGPRSHLRAPIGVKFYTAKRTHVPLVCASAPNLKWIGATSRPCWAKMLIFDLWENFDTGR